MLQVTPGHQIGGGLDIGVMIGCILNSPINASTWAYSMSCLEWTKDKSRGLTQVPENLEVKMINPG